MRRVDLEIMLRKKREAIRRLLGMEKGFGSFKKEGGNVNWVYKRQKTGWAHAENIGGDYDGDKRIRVFIKAIMNWSDNSRGAVVAIDEIVIHELCHWAVDNELNQEMVSNPADDHSERWRKVLHPIIFSHYGFDHED